MIQIIMNAGSLQDALLLGSGFLIAIYVAIVFHEIAHGYAALLNGDSTAKMAGRLSLNPAAHFDLVGFLMLILVGFGYAKPVPVDPRNFYNYKKGMIWVSVAGVLTNIVLAFILTPFYMLIGNASVSSLFWFNVLKWLYYFLYFCILININLALFNLLPIAPLDGFNLLAALTKPGNRFVNFMRRYSMLILLMLIFWEYIPIIGVYSPLSIYITTCNSGIMWVFTKFWGLFGL